MDRLMEYIKKMYEKLKAMSTRSKVAFGIIFVGVIISLILFAYNMSANKYGVLFNKLSADDGKNITAQLTAKKETYEVVGDSILVLKSRVYPLRMELASSITNGSQGYELFDNMSQFGVTDDQFNMTKLRATQGELEKTIKSFPQIENARVQMALPTDSPFISDKTPGSIAVYLQMKQDMKLDANQVRAIISLISASVANVPKENIKIIDQNLTDLSKDVFSKTVSTPEDNIPTLQAQQKEETDFENKLQSAITDMLEPAIGKDKVIAKVNAVMNFDAVQNDIITYDPNKVVLSSHIITNGGTSSVNGDTSSPVDNNMTNYIGLTTGSGIVTSPSSIDATYNFQVGSKHSQQIVAPGGIIRLTASVMIDGNMSNAQKAQIQSVVANTIGFNASRGDAISVAAMTFDTTAKTEAQKAIDDLKKQTANAAKMQLYKTIAMAAAGFILFIIILIAVIRSRRAANKSSAEGIDVMVGDTVYDHNNPNHIPLNLDVESEADHVSKDIKKYAEEKPDQVVDIIKSWLAEDER
jgi:flagellar M-ring protein FliF